MARTTSKQSGPSGKSKRSSPKNSKKPATKKRELSAFLFLTVLLAPAMSVAVVGGYGFAIWIYQLIAGPPGAP
ncbi:MAG: periplasmic nitrate reductase, NapE protein [Hyphomicrobiaceae bacterium]|nr:periplasmic nitrate reductase, NapE protein [Hyphomicrobiaceae bacterium]